MTFANPRTLATTLVLAVAGAFAWQARAGGKRMRALPIRDRLVQST